MQTTTIHLTQESCEKIATRTLRELIAKGEVPLFDFFHDNFTLDEKRALRDACKEAIEADKELLAMMRNEK